MATTVLSSAQESPTLPNITHAVVMYVIRVFVQFRGVSSSLSGWVTTIIGGGGSVGEGTARCFSLPSIAMKPSAEQEKSR